MKNRFLTKSMITAVLLGGALSFTSCNDEFNEKDFLNQQYDLAEKKSAADYARKLQEMAEKFKDHEARERLAETLRRENRLHYLEEYQKAGLFKKINFVALDAVTKKPVKGVKITLFGETATSNEQGIATLKKVPVGAGIASVDAPEDYFSAEAPFYNPYKAPRKLAITSGTGTQDVYWMHEHTKTIHILPKSSMTKEYTTVKGTVKMDIDMTNDTLESAPDGTEVRVDYSNVAGIGTSDNTNPQIAGELYFYAYFIKDGQGLPDKTVTKNGAYSIKLPAIDDIKLVLAEETAIDVTYINKAKKKVTTKGYFAIPTSVSDAYEDLEPEDFEAQKLFNFKFSDPKAGGLKLGFKNLFEPYGEYTDRKTTVDANTAGGFTATDAVGGNNAQLGVVLAGGAGTTPFDVVLLGKGYKSHPTISATPALTGGDGVFLRGQFEVKTGGTGTPFKMNLTTTDYTNARAGAHSDARATGQMPTVSHASITGAGGTEFHVYGTVIDGLGAKHEDVLIGNVFLKVTGSNVAVEGNMSAILNNSIPSAPLSFVGKYNDPSDKSKNHHSVVLTHIAKTSNATANQKVDISSFNATLNYKDYDANAASSSNDKSKNPYKLFAYYVKDNTGTSSTFTAYPTFDISGGTPDTAAQFSLGANRVSKHSVSIDAPGADYVELPNMQYKENGYGTILDMFGTTTGSGEFTIDTSGKVVALSSTTTVTKAPAEVASFFTSSTALKGYAFVAINQKDGTVAQNNKYANNRLGTPITTVKTGLRSSSISTAYATSTGKYKTKPTHTYLPKYTWAADNEVTKAEFSYGHSTSDYKVNNFRVTKAGKYIDVLPMAGETPTPHHIVLNLSTLAGKEKVHNFILEEAQGKK